MSISLPFAAVSDVSRASEISVGMYLRSSPPSSTEETGMGNSDIFLGGIKVLPDFTVRPDLPSPMAVDSCVSRLVAARRTDSKSLVDPRFCTQDKPHSDEWHQVTGGSGEVNVQIQYKAAQNVPLTIDAFELLKVVGKGSFGKASVLSLSATAGEMDSPADARQTPPPHRSCRSASATRCASMRSRRSARRTLSRGPR